MLSAQNNAQLVTALRKAEQTPQNNAMLLQQLEQKRLLAQVHLQHANKNVSSHAHPAGALNGKAIGSMVSAGLARVGVANMAGASRPTAVPAGQMTPAYAAAVAANAAQKRALNVNSTVAGSATTMPTAKKQYTMPQRMVNGVPVQGKNGNAKPVSLVPVAAVPTTARSPLPTAAVPARASAVLSPPVGVLPPSLVLAPSVPIPPVAPPSNSSTVYVDASVGGAIVGGDMVNVAAKDEDKAPPGSGPSLG